MNRVLQWIGVSAMGLIVLIAGFVGIFWIWRLPIWSSLDSGWVQAIGSLLALAVAIFVMGRQNRHASQLLIQTEERQRRRNLGTAAYLLRRAIFQVTQGCELIQATLDQPALAAARVEALRDSAIASREILSNIPILDLGAGDIAAAIQFMKDTLQSTADSMTRLAPVIATVPDEPEVVGLLNSLISMAGTATELLDTQIEKAGA